MQSRGKQFMKTIYRASLGDRHALVAAYVEPVARLYAEAWFKKMPHDVSEVDVGEFIGAGEETGIIQMLDDNELAGILIKYAIGTEYGTAAHAELSKKLRVEYHLVNPLSGEVHRIKYNGEIAQLGGVTPEDYWKYNIGL